MNRVNVRGLGVESGSGVWEKAGAAATVRSAVTAMKRTNMWESPGVDMELDAPGLRFVADEPRLADPRQLVPRKEVHDPGAAERGSQHDHSRVVGSYPAYHNRPTPQNVTP